MSPESRREGDVEMKTRLPIETQRSAAGMAQLRRQVRIKAQVAVKKTVEVAGGGQDDPHTRHSITGRIWLDLADMDFAPFRFKPEVDDFGMGDIYVEEFRPMSGALAGGAKDLAAFYEGALVEILTSKPSLLKG